jgi:SPP1 gp7 family putative phage head morphogenesis protein
MPSSPRTQPYQPLQPPSLPPEEGAPPPTAQQVNDNAVIATVAGILATGLPVASAGAYVIVALTGAGITTAAAMAAWKLLAATLTPEDQHGPAGRAIASMESSYRAAYLVNASRRIMVSLKTGDLKRALSAEAGYFKMHLQATAKRKAVGKQVDAQVAIHGKTLGWKAVMDTRTSAECAAMDGENFSVDDPPVIGWPGTVHLHCRCKAVAPFASADAVPSRVLAYV